LHNLDYSLLTNYYSSWLDNPTMSVTMATHSLVGPSNTTEQHFPVAENHQQVTWTTILWSLLAVALNTMLQPAGTVCGGPPSLGFMLRSSPVICLIDTSYLLARLGWYWTQERRSRETASPFRSAHARLIALRYQSWVAGTCDEYDSISSVQKSQQARIISFLLTSAQMLRIFAFKGLYWSKAIASTYLASFIIVELLVVCYRPTSCKVDMCGDKKNCNNSNAHRETPIQSSGIFSLSYQSVAFAVAFIMFFGTAAVNDISGESDTNLPKHLGLYTICAWTIAFSFAWAMCAVEEPWREVLKSTPLLLGALGIPVVYYILGPQMLVNVHRLQHISAVSIALNLAWILILGLPYATIVTGSVRSRAHDSNNNNISEAQRQIAIRADKTRKRIEKTLAWYFVILHLVTTVLYYRFSYDPAGTSEPKWSSYLN
jgi:hypothetical protein